MAIKEGGFPSWWTVEDNLSCLARSIRNQAQKEATRNALPFGGADVEFPRAPSVTVFLGGSPAYLRMPLSDVEIETFYNLLVGECSRHGDSCET
ncbi:MAG: hypothetical protein Q7S12_04650 [bacterium]|nr:hypothetical protein [bacterium]